MFRSKTLIAFLSVLVLMAGGLLYYNHATYHSFDPRMTFKHTDFKKFEFWNRVGSDLSVNSVDAKLGVSDAQARTELFGTIQALQAALTTGSLAVDGNSWSDSGYTPIKAPSKIAGVGGDFAIPSGVTIYVQNTGDKSTFCASETTPDGKSTWVATSADNNIVKGQPCSHA